MRNYLKEIFYLQRDDRVAVFTLLAVAVVATVLVFWLGGSPSDAPVAQQADSLAVRPLPAHRDDMASRGGYYQVESEVQAERFPFDPNTADSTQLLRLGLSPWQVRSIYRYRAKGGVYRHPNDFARLYGLTRKQFRELLPYIRISDDYQPAADYYTSPSSSRPRRQFVDTASAAPRPHPTPVRKLSPGQHVAVNTADTALLKMIPGIGSGYARMIVAYRERLGGFTSLSQVLESGPVPESALSYLTVDASAVRKLNVNKLSLNQLRRHPYINFYQAREICEYRRLRGPLHSLDDLKLSREFPAEQIERLRPYVTF